MSLVIKLGPWLSSLLGKTLENPSLPTKTLYPWMILILSSTLHVLRGNRYLEILRVKATTVSVRLQIYLFALTNTNTSITPCVFGCYHCVARAARHTYKFTCRVTKHQHNTLWEHHNPPSSGGLDQWLTSSITRIASVAH